MPLISPLIAFVKPFPVNGEASVIVPLISVPYGIEIFDASSVVYHVTPIDSSAIG